LRGDDWKDRGVAKAAHPNLKPEVLEMNSSRRAIPSVEKVLQALGQSELPRAILTAIVRQELSALREAKAVPEFETVLSQIKSAATKLSRTRIQTLINGTGVVIHTNLGRAPLSKSAIKALVEIGGYYNNLEFDLEKGERGSRGLYVEHLLTALCQSEAATVVNNCAAALVLILRHFTKNKPEVVISRGELVQIGGGFRIPDILETSGAQLREVGTTNKTSIEDYSRAITEGTGLILKVHRSNFFMGGFVESAATDELSALAREKNVPLVEDLGSGALIRTETIAGISHEPTPAEVISLGVDLVCFSGDKLFGGPQAGIIAGKKDLIAALKKDPFFRALRCDKLILAALQATAENYLSEEGCVPTIEMLKEPLDQLRQRAESLLALIGNPQVKISVGSGKGQVGGGTLPQSELESITLDILPRAGTLEQFAENLRSRTPAIIGYIADSKFKLDLRTIFPEQESLVADALNSWAPASNA
jgi:L-seryl-tRNA(Ser) seleniumtransferase